MENKIQELTDKIYREGVEKGNEEAQKLIAKAQEEAKRIIEDAHKEADSIVATAHKSNLLFHDMHKIHYFCLSKTKRIQACLTVNIYL